MKVAIAPVLLAVVAAVAIGSCGESKQDKAKKTVCSARADISKQVDQLKGLTISSATADAVQQSVQAIRSDLSKIKDAQGDLSDDRRQQVEAANKAFTSQTQSIVEGLGSSTSLSDAKSQLTSATQELATAYQQSFARIDCS
jgi:outer membrane protein TolC